MNLDEILGHRTHMDRLYVLIVYQYVVIVYDYLDDRDDYDCDVDRDHDVAIHDRFQNGHYECYDDENVYWLCFLSFEVIDPKSFHFFAIVIVTDVVTASAIDHILFDFYKILIVQRYEEGLVALMMSLVWDEAEVFPKLNYCSVWQFDYF